jgi:hypothetical protein
LELKLDKTRSFYILEKRASPDESITLYDNMDEAIRKVAEYIKAKIPTGQLGLSVVTVEKDKLTVTGVAWSVIAEKLVSLK